jgi:hypothetical protein
MDTDTGIVTSIDPARLPPYERITCAPISEAVAALDAARAALAEAKKSLVAAQQELPQSQWADAEAAEKARAEGKPEPKTRSHTQQHERRIENLEHEQRVCQLAAERSERELLAAVDAHGQQWAEEVDATCDGLLKQWQAEVSEVSALYGQLASVLAIRRVISEGKQPRVGAVEFAPAQVQGREWAGGQGPSVRPIVQVGDILAALGEVGKIPPEPEPVVQPPLARKPSDLENAAPVAEEISERKDREAATEARRAQLLAEQDD